MIVTPAAHPLPPPTGLRRARLGRRRTFAAMTAPAITAEHLARSFGPTRALVDVSFAVEAGTVCALLGRNGAGKTTTVRILTTLLPADAGRARVAGFDVTDQAPEVRTRIGVTGQTATMDELLTGAENLETIGRFCHLGAATSRRRATRAAGAVRPHRRCPAAGQAVLGRDATTSRPRRQPDRRARGALPGRAHHRVGPGQPRRDVDVDPQPGRGGDHRLLTTQYLDEADRLADTIVVVDRGLVVAEGTPEQLKASIGRPFVRVTLATRTPPAWRGCGDCSARRRR